MTALSEYDRLESSGLWRATKDAQRRNVIVSMGDATLTISDASGTALAHWSLPAITRLNPGQSPATFAPAPDADEDLELEDDALITALEKVRAVIKKRRPHKGRLRHLLTASFLATLVGLGVFWLPDALVTYTVQVVPQASRSALGTRLQTRIQRVAGRACRESLGAQALSALGHNLLGQNAPPITVLTQATRPALHLPGGQIVLSNTLLEKYDSPFVIAAYIIAEDERARLNDPMLALLNHAGLKATLTLLTSGDLPDPVLDRYAETLMTSASAPLPDDNLLTRFAAAKLPTSPYAYAQDPSGETTLSLIEADRLTVDQTQMPLSDGQWISLQGICTE